MKLDLSIAYLVRGEYIKCFNKDMSQRDRFASIEPIDYVESFGIYTNDYSDLKELGFGIEIVDPQQIGYSLGRNGDCLDFVLHMLGIKYGANDIAMYEKRLEDLPTINAPTEGCVVLYYSKIFYSEATIEHRGIFRDGKIISKWGDGPIFENGNFSAVPYVTYQLINDMKVWKEHTIVFKDARKFK